MIIISGKKCAIHVAFAVAIIFFVVFVGWTVKYASILFVTTLYPFICMYHLRISTCWRLFSFIVCVDAVAVVADAVPWNLYDAKTCAFIWKPFVPNVMHSSTGTLYNNNDNNYTGSSNEQIQRFQTLFSLCLFIIKL